MDLPKRLGPLTHIFFSTFHLFGFPFVKTIQKKKNIIIDFVNLFYLYFKLLLIKLSAIIQINFT